MTLDIKNKAWFSKHKPESIEGLIFDNPDHEALMVKWIQEQKIDGNLLMYGPPGLGKTLSAELLIKTVIKAQNDLFICKDRNVKEIREKVKPFLTKRPAKSNQKIVYIEEIDRLHPDALNDLKDGSMEKFLHNCVFIGCTNYIGKLKQKDSAVLSRFTHKISFSGSNTEGIFKRLSNILNDEGAQYDPTALKEFIEKNQKSGIREMLNQLQISFTSNAGQINFESIQGYSGIEENVTNLIMNIMKVTVALDPKSKRICLTQPLNSPIAQDYQTLATLLHNNYDINYNSIFDRLHDASSYIPVKMIIAKYADENEFKKYQHMNILGCLYEIMKCMIEITG